VKWRTIPTTSALLLAGSLAAFADSLVVSAPGNDDGYTDGLNYTSYVTVAFQGADYQALSIAPAADPGVQQWDAIYVPLTDTAAILNVMQAYFPDVSAAEDMPKLYADMVGWVELSSSGLGASANDAIQEAVWAQFDPSEYTDAIGLFQLAQTAAPNGYGAVTIGDGRLAPVDLGFYGLLVDVNYDDGPPLNEVFLIDAPPPLFGTPEPASLVLTMAGLAVLAATRMKRRTA
jgi:hypothetical protein